MRHEVRPDRFLMVGNSVRSDILPVLGSWRARRYVPYHVTWQHETVELDPGVRRARGAAGDAGRACCALSGLAAS